MGALWHALKALRDATPVERRRAEGRVYELLYRRLVGFARKARQEGDAADIATDVFMHLCESIGQCKALDELDPQRGAAMAFNWIRRAFATRLVSWLRKNRKESLLKETLQAENREGEPAVNPEVAPDDVPVRQLAIAEARAGIRKIIATGKRDDPFFQEAKKLEVALTPPGLERQLLAFDYVKAQGKTLAETARLMNQGEGTKQEQDRIAKWVQRGRGALLVGARFATIDQGEPSVLEALEKMIDALSQPEKGRKS